MCGARRCRGQGEIAPYSEGRHLHPVRAAKPSRGTHLPTCASRRTHLPRTAGAGSGRYAVAQDDSTAMQSCSRERGNSRHRRLSARPLFATDSRRDQAISVVPAKAGTQAGGLSLCLDGVTGQRRGHGSEANRAKPRTEEATAPYARDRSLTIVAICSQLSGRR